MNPKILNGDWICNCGYHNFAQNLTCSKCRYYKGTGTTIHVLDKPSFSSIIATPIVPPIFIPTVQTVFTPTVSLKKGDWICKRCTFHNFAKNFKCKKCGSFHS